MTKNKDRRIFQIRHGREGMSNIVLKFHDQISQVADLFRRAYKTAEKF